MSEEWKDILGFEESYQISNIGNVRSKDRMVTYSNGRIAFCPGKMIKTSVATNGYVIVCLSKNGKQSKKLVHRLVANAFIDNPNLLPEINHIDENKRNNRAENLEWCTVKYNRNFGSRNKRAAEHKDYNAIAKKNRLIQGKPVIQIEKNGEIIGKFLSTRHAESVTGFHRQAISGCCNGKYKYAYGFKWMYE